MIEIILAYDELETIRELFEEYTNMLIQKDEKFRDYLSEQNYDEEFENPKIKYGLPYGRLFLLKLDKIPIGCVALRKVNESACEMKRLYIKPEYRGNGYSHLLVDKVVESAKEIGYEYIILDTLPYLETALRLYKEYGFEETEPFNDNPMGNSIYMRLKISGE
jgi:N-acetylglutamate synthase and related acetyltransferases